jgi:transposase
MFAIRPGSRGLQLERTREWVRQQRDWLPMQRELLTIYFAQLDSQAQRRKQLTGLIAQEVSAEPLMLRSMKLLGIGMINAFALLAIIGDVRRFERPKKMVAYIGLNPGQRQSGAGKNIKIGIGKRCRSDLRHLLIQGSQAVLKMGRHTPLGKWGWKLFARKGHRNPAAAGPWLRLPASWWFKSGICFRETLPSPWKPTKVWPSSSKSSPSLSGRACASNSACLLISANASWISNRESSAHPPPDHPV